VIEHGADPIFRRLARLFLTRCRARQVFAVGRRLPNLAALTPKLHFA
jgi:hypothetical protein